MNSKISSIIVIIIGAGLLLASLFADVIGIGDDVGFGPQQKMGTIAGLVILGVGIYLSRQTASAADHTPESSE